MKRIINKSLLVAALFSAVSVNAGHFSWGVSIGFGVPVYCPPPVVYAPAVPVTHVVYQPQVVVVPQPVVYHQPVVIMPQPVVYYPPTATIWVGGGHHHGHRR